MRRQCRRSQTSTPTVGTDQHCDPAVNDSVLDLRHTCLMSGSPVRSNRVVAPLREQLVIIIACWSGEERDRIRSELSRASWQRKGGHERARIIRAHLRSHHTPHEVQLFFCRWQRCEAT